MVGTSMPSIRLNPGAVRAELSRLSLRNVSDVADQVEAQAKILAPVQTGHLRASIRKVPVFSVRGPTFRVEATASYAPFVENDTAPHIIRPRRAQVLRFRVGGRVVYAKIVHHPGTKGQHFLAKAVRQVAMRNGWNSRITG
jgi:hypothetical protein